MRKSIRSLSFLFLISCLVSFGMSVSAGGRREKELRIDSKRVTNQPQSQEQEPQNRVEGRFEYLDKEYGIICNPYTHYKGSYQGMIDEQSLNIEFLDRNALLVTIWIKNIQIDNVVITLKGKKTGCVPVNVSSLIAPRVKKLTAKVDAIYLRIRLTPYQDRKTGELKYSPLVLDSTQIYGFKWTNRVGHQIPRWAHHYMEYRFQEGMKEILRSPDAWKVSEMVGEAINKKVMK